MALNIKKQIFSRGLEVKEIARRMGISPIALSKHINGNPSVEVLERIANAIGCRVVDLFEEEEQTNTIVCPKCGARFELKED